MEITPKQQRNMYALFVGMFAINVAFSIWNIREQAKLRELQRALASEQLIQTKKQNRRNGEDVGNT